LSEKADFAQALRGRWCRASASDSMHYGEAVFCRRRWPLRRGRWRLMRSNWMSTRTWLLHGPQARPWRNWSRSNAMPLASQGWLQARNCRDLRRLRQRIRLGRSRGARLRRELLNLAGKEPAPHEAGLRHAGRCGERLAAGGRHAARGALSRTGEGVLLHAVRGDDMELAIRPWGYSGAHEYACLFPTARLPPDPRVLTWPRPRCRTLRRKAPAGCRRLAGSSPRLAPETRYLWR